MDDNEIELWKEYETSKSEDIRNILVEKYAGLVKYVAKNLFHKVPKNVEFDDLVSAGIFGLFDAIEKFDLALKVQFKTYAVTRIQGAILDEMRAQDPLKRSVRQKIRRIEEATKILQDKHERQPTEDEILEFTELSAHSYDKIMSYIHQSYILSLNDVLFANNDGEQLSYFDKVGTAVDDAPEKIFEQKDLERVLQGALKELPERELQVIILYYYQELTLKEIGMVLNVTESRVSQLHGKALHKLKAKLFSYKKGVFEK